jgi:hypothetical protein
MEVPVYITHVMHITLSRLFSNTTNEVWSEKNVSPLIAPHAESQKIEKTCERKTLALIESF